jgi:hypothetical protein
MIQMSGVFAPADVTEVIFPQVSDQLPDGGRSERFFCFQLGLLLPPLELLPFRSSR